jgi:hypothetical protein
VVISLDFTTVVRQRYGDELREYSVPLDFHAAFYSLMHD